MENKSSYLANLKFEPKLLNNFVAKYISNVRLVLLFAFLIVIIGIQSFINLPRTLNPEIKIPIVLISTVLPGANPDDVESLITIPIEDSVENVSGIKQVTSTSRDSISIISIEFESGTDPEKARSDVKTQVDSIRDFPEDAQDPQVEKLDFENQPVWTFALITSHDPLSLVRVSKNLKKKLEDAASIDRVSTTGLEEEEVQILIKPEAITTYNINPQALAAAVGASTGSLPAGSVRTERNIFPLAINPSVTSLEELRKIKLSINGSILSLGQIATVRQIPKPNQLNSLFADPQNTPKPSVTFNIFRASTASFEKSIQDAERIIDEELEKHKLSYEVKTVFNTGEDIQEQYSELIRDFSITIILVFIILLIFLGIRQAFVTSLAIPLTFLITFTVMNITGIALSFIALFSFLLSLGLLVDDAIVVISAMTAYFRTRRFTPFETGLLVWRDFFVPILTTTITTVWAFIPLLLSSGIIGEFIKPIPIVVSSMLLASLIVAMLITLPITVMLLGAKVPRRVRIFLSILLLLFAILIFFLIIPKSTLFPIQIILFIGWLFITFAIRKTLINQGKTIWRRLTNRFTQLSHGRRYFDEGFIHFSKISNVYYRVIRRILLSPAARRNTIIMVIIFSIFSYLLLPLGFVKNEFFPSSDQDYIFVTIEYPSGTSSDIVTREAKTILDKMRKYEGLDFVIADVGQSFSTEGFGTGGDTNSVLFNIRLKEGRTVTSIDLGTKIREEFASYHKGRISVTESTGGPPAGADLQIQILGDDLSTIDFYANKIQDYLAKQEGVVDVNKSVKSGVGKLIFVPENEMLVKAGLNEQQVGFWLRTFASGFTLDSVILDESENTKIDINLRFFDKLQSPSQITSLSIPTSQGSLPLASLGKLQLTYNPTLITREDGKRTISVSGGVLPGFTIADKNRELEQFANSLNLPDGYSWKTGGVNEENQRSVNSILQAMLLSFLLIIVTIVIQFSSFRKAIIVMLVIPLSISGVFVIFALTHTPLSFPALIGVLALFGIVVKNSILVVDKITQNEKAGMGFVDAIADASESRLEPIALTSFTAIVGLIPITITDPIWRGLGGAIIAGLTFSGTIMLFFIPIVYYYWFRPSERVTKMS